MGRGNLFVRLECGESAFLRSLDLDAPVPFDGAIVADGCFSTGANLATGQQLAAALAELRVPWLLDPDTARLGDHRAASGANGAISTRMARVLKLPLTPRLALPSGEAEALVDAAGAVQLSSPMFTAPYLEVGGDRDPRLEANVRLLALAGERAGDRLTVAVLQMPLRYLCDGSGVRAASALASAGAEMILIRIRGFHAERASSEDVVAYGYLVGSIASTGTWAVPDAVGRLGPTLVACGAEAFSTGSVGFRAVSADLLDGSRGEAAGDLLWEIPDGFAAIRTSERRTGVDAQLCRYPRCPAPEGVGDAWAVRIHNLHELQRQARFAAREGFGFGRRLRASGSPLADGWAVGLDRLQRLAA